VFREQVPPDVQGSALAAPACVVVGGYASSTPTPAAIMHTVSYAPVKSYRKWIGALGAGIQSASGWEQIKTAPNALKM
jgi:hypothetical protein